ncbi:olfactory receptor 1J2-like [Hyperolius riggenbachi]|uniref:olfactory receptor 1J2-like n=1 Tax=Hyperolius riggenbachi TaxID=752182 RepID=UPI0035A32DFE
MNRKMDQSCIAAGGHSVLRYQKMQEEKRRRLIPGETGPERGEVEGSGLSDSVSDIMISHPEPKTLDKAIALAIKMYRRGIVKSNVTTIFLLGFHTPKLTLLLFTLVLVIYCVTLCGNLLIILLVSFSMILHSPMYFFLTQLSIADIILTTAVSPNMLHVLLHEWGSLSLSGCISQLYFSGMSITSECFLLTVMSYDRYLAVCSPLHYTSTMNHALCVKFILACWLISCCFLFTLTFGISQLQFCGPDTIDHFLCDFNPFLELSCSDVSIVQMESTLLGIPVLVLPFLMIILSYMYIVSNILKISSFAGRLKSFSTCSSHLTVVSIFYGTLTGSYMLPNKVQSQMASKIMAMFYTMFSPLINPFIYSLRNRDIKQAFKALYKKMTYY